MKGRTDLPGIVVAVILLVAALLLIWYLYAWPVEGDSVLTALTELLPFQVLLDPGGAGSVLLFSSNLGRNGLAMTRRGPD